jgi:heme-degrading monooxygenase HmoA
MHGRIVSVEVKPQDIGTATSIYQESVVPAAQQQKGFRGAMLFTDARTGKAVSITLWDSEEELLAGQESGYYQEQLAKFAELLVRRPEQAGYELSCKAQVQI